MLHHECSRIKQRKWRKLVDIFWLYIILKSTTRMLHWWMVTFFRWNFEDIYQYTSEMVSRPVCHLFRRKQSRLTKGHSWQKTRSWTKVEFDSMNLFLNRSWKVTSQYMKCPLYNFVHCILNSRTAFISVDTCFHMRLNPLPSTFRLK